MGIFCLETASWDESLAGGRTSYEHFLRFLEVSAEGKIPHRHYDVATQAELEFYLDAWKKEMQKDFPVLLLAFHSDEKNIGITTLDGETLPMKHLVPHLGNEDEEYDNDNDAIIHISSCYPVKGPKMEYLLKDGALSVSGYTSGDVDWYDAAAFEMLFLERLVAHGPPDSSLMMRDFVDDICEENPLIMALGEVLDFHLWYRVDDGKIKTDHSSKNVHAVTRKDLIKKYGD